MLVDFFRGVHDLRFPFIYILFFFCPFSSPFPWVLSPAFFFVYLCSFSDGVGVSVSPFFFSSCSEEKVLLYLHFNDSTCRCLS